MTKTKYPVPSNTWDKDRARLERARAQLAEARVHINILLAHIKSGCAGDCEIVNAARYWLTERSRD